MNKILSTGLFSETLGGYSFISTWRFMGTLGADVGRVAETLIIHVIHVFCRTNL